MNRKHMMRYLIISILALALVGCTSTNAVSQEEAKPKNIIFLIGDGMGVSAVSIGSYYGEQPTIFKEFRSIGLQNTSSAKQKVTDSAASGTALATGTRTYNGAIGVDTAKNELQSIAELLAEKGWSTGVVATSTISHATPASFYAHVERRSMEEVIVEQLLDSPIDFFAGGGLVKFKHRADGQDLLPMAAEKGFIIDTTALAAPGSLEGGKKYGFLLNQGAMPRMIDGRGSFLPEATSLAIEHLGQNEKGFFVMVESSQIDWAGHSNSFDYMEGEMLDFEAVIQVALDFAKVDGNTLLVVTADHETGGFAMSPKTKGDYNEDYTDYNELVPGFATGQHTASLIPVFAFGPGAEHFQGLYDNTEIFDKMARLAGLGD